MGCLTCNADAMCTEVDNLNGQTKNTFYKGYKLELRVGGPHQAPDARFGLRFGFCYASDLCHAVSGWSYKSIKQFRHAMSGKEQCKLELTSSWNMNRTDDEELPIKEMEKEYREYCPKSKSNNIIFCPKSIIKKKKDVKVQWINDYFKNFEKSKKKTK